MTTDQLRKAILEYKEKEERSYNYIARKTGLDSSHIRKFVNGDRGMSEARQQILIDFLTGSEK